MDKSLLIRTKSSKFGYGKESKNQAIQCKSTRINGIEEPMVDYRLLNNLHFEYRLTNSIEYHTNMIYSILEWAEIIYPPKSIQRYQQQENNYLQTCKQNLWLKIETLYKTGKHIQHNGEFIWTKARWIRAIKFC